MVFFKVYFFVFLENLRITFPGRIPGSKNINRKSLQVNEKRDGRFPRRRSFGITLLSPAGINSYPPDFAA
jgi:hypothetical protein